MSKLMTLASPWVVTPINKLCYNIPMAEMIEVVDPEGRVLGLRPRGEVHGNPELLHRVVHLIVVNSKGEILLQKRSMDKDVAPGRWDTSVGGHIAPGEALEEALKRETLEELGFVPENVRFLYKYIHRNPYESELVYTFETLYEGPFNYNRQEVSEVRFWSVRQIKEALGTDLLSENFKEEFQRYIKHKKEAT